jgi:nucleoside-diphosphate-sugar epimerase
VPDVNAPTAPRSKPTRVAVTGANGTIGRVVLDRLRDRYDLLALTHRPAGFPSQAIELHDLASVVAAVRGADAILHLGGASTVEASWDSVLEANIVGVRNVFEAAALAGVPKVVFASSNHVVGGYETDEAPGIYRGRRGGPIGELAELRPDSLYGASKAFGEILGRYYADHRGLAVICVRIGTVRPDDDPASVDIASTAAWLRLSLAERYERMRATWLSHRDCADLLATAIDTDARWAVVYGVSDNPARFWSLEGARRELGFRPADRAPATGDAHSPSQGKGAG